jgi:preprotein translocase subunit YajC
MNTCAATCPNLYQALSVYVATLEMFTFALILPLLFLPCIYLWFLRRATAEAEAFTQLQDRLQEEEALLSNGGITAGEILDSLENVKLVSRPSNNGSGEAEVWLLPWCATSSSIGTSSDVKECCICMNEFGVQSEQGGDVESGFQDDGEGLVRTEVPGCDMSTASASTDPKETSIVRTRCGHVFHKEVRVRIFEMGVAITFLVVLLHLYGCWNVVSRRMGRRAMDHEPTGSFKR